MRLNVTFVISPPTSLRGRWLLDLKYAEVAAALGRRHIQTARAVYFGRNVQEATLPLTLAEGRLPTQLPGLGHGNNLDMGLRLAHTLAGSTPTLVVVIHDLLGVAGDLPTTVHRASANIVQLFTVQYDPNGDYNEQLAEDLAAAPRTTVLLPMAPHRSASELSAFLTQLNRSELGMSA